MIGVKRKSSEKKVPNLIEKGSVERKMKDKVLTVLVQNGKS